MIIYVEDNLDDIKEKLINKGYNIIEDQSQPCDAIICNLKENNNALYSMQNNIKKEGTLIIDCGSKSIEDIEYIINNRAYSSIF